MSLKQKDFVIKKQKDEEELDDEVKIEEDDVSQTSKKKRGKKIDASEIKRHSCEVCQKSFQGLNDLRKHFRIHSDERPYECLHCLKKFRQAGCLKNHIASQHGSDEEFICHYCNKSFPIKERLRLHLRIHSGEKPYKCALCPKTFARGGQLTQHLATHNGLKKYKCEHCPAAFAFAANLKMHMKGHLNERDYTCHLCGKGFVRPDSLKKHLQHFHANIKKLRCEICNKTFKGHLLQHMRTHKNLRPHGCSVCGSTFSQRSQLNVHARTHSGERPYRCQVCWRAFAHSSVLKLHIRKHTGEKPFKCPICVKSQTAFSQLPHLKKHMLAIHNMDKPYMCSSCEEFFKTKLEYQMHVVNCMKLDLNQVIVDDFSEPKVSTSQVSTSMSIAKMRLLVAILLKRISSDKRLQQLGYEKRLIDNVLIDSLKLAERNVCEDTKLSEAERLKVNIQELLEWTVPPDYMKKFHSEQRSVEELLLELTKT